MRCGIAAVTLWPRGSRVGSTPTGADCWSLAGGSGMWACPKVLTVYWLGRRGLAATTQVQRRAGTCGHASHTQSHSYHSHPKKETAQDPISIRVCGCLAAPSPLFPQIITISILTSLDQA